jgi:hypothetical protein
VFDIVAPDFETSLLPDETKLVLHVNPSSMKMAYTKVIERTQTLGGFVEFHWGDGPGEITFEMATGGFMRLYTGLSNVTGGFGSLDVGGTRRETIAYDKYLDLLALFHNNGAIYDANGNIFLEGAIKVAFDGGVYVGWFNSFSVSEEVSKPYQFALSAGFTTMYEIVRFRTTPMPMMGASIGQ